MPSINPVGVGPEPVQSPSNRISIWSWQTPAWFASGRPFPWFRASGGANSYYAPFAGNGSSAIPNPTASVADVANAAHAAFASGQVYSDFRTPAL